MTDFITPRTWTNGEIPTDSVFNAHLRDQLNALWVGTTAGDIDYYSAPLTKARLGKPSADSFLQNTSGGVLSWVSVSSIGGGLNSVGMVEGTTEFTTTSTTGTDITGMTTTITTTKTCNLFLFASGSIASTRDAGGASVNPAILYSSIGGVTHTLDASCPETYASQYTPVSNIWMRSSVSAGSIIFKLILATNGGGHTAHWLGGTLIAVAFSV